MQIIRERDGDVITMMPLLCQWGVKRCNVLGCTNQPNTIVVDLAPGVRLAGFCEEHYQQANVPGGAQLALDFGGRP